MVNFTHHDAGTAADRWAAGGLTALPELPLDGEELARTAFIVLAAHPDDESLGAGGLIARLHERGAKVTFLLCTAGEASHPGSPTTTPDRLAAVRLEEFSAALARLLPDPAGPAADWRYLGLPDGNLAGHREQIRSALAEAAAACGQTSGRIIVVTPYRHDGHTDHETLGSVAAGFCASRGYGLLEYPIWYWLWADPADPADEAWRAWVRLPLSPAEQRAKEAAMASHASQIRALSALPGDEVLLTPAFLEHFGHPWETFAWHGPAPAGRALAAADAEAVFDAVHRREEDPWQYTSSWYERRKRALTLGVLPDENYAAGLEVGCSIGTLSVELAQRCGSFLAVDASSAALEHASRTAGPDSHGTDPAGHGSAGLAGRDLRSDRRLRGGVLPCARRAGCPVFQGRGHATTGRRAGPLPLAASHQRLGPRRRRRARRRAPAAGLGRCRAVPGARLRPRSASGSGGRRACPGSGAETTMTTGSRPLPPRHRIARVVVVMPAHNEEEHLDPALDAVRGALDALHRIRPEVESGVKVVLDGCTDASAEITARHAAADRRISALEVPFRSAGASRAAGIRAAGVGISPKRSGRGRCRQPGSGWPIRTRIRRSRRTG